MLQEPTSLAHVLMIVLIGMGLVFTLLILLIGCTLGLSVLVRRLDSESDFTSQTPTQSQELQIAAAAATTAHHRRLITQQVLS